MRYLIVIWILLTAQLAMAQVPAKPQTKSILLLGATAHLGTGEVIKNAAIGFRDGKLDMVLAAIDYRMDSTKYDTVIHLKGQHAYPGFIAPNSRLGLVEIGAVRASRDYDDVTFNPHVRSLGAYNTDSRIIPTIRSNGILVAQVAPVGGIISGSSSIFALEGWNWQDAVLRTDDGIHLYWPEEKLHLKGEEEKEAGKAAEKYREQVTSIADFFEAAVAYRKTDFHMQKNLRYEMMKKVLTGKAKLYVHADKVQQITDAIYFLDGYPIDWVLVGGYDSWLVAELLHDRKIPVLLRRVHALPEREGDDIDLPYKLPRILSEKGLLVGLQNSGSMEAMGTRNLPFYAGTAAHFGMEKEKALQLITLNNAKILGIADRLGSLETGKDATLFISAGDALDMRTNAVSLAFIDGKLLDLTNPQIELYEKFRKKR